jgi:tRNA modification GTPase
MPADLEDTIVALSSAAGPGGRAIVRLSGAAAFNLAGQVFLASEPIGAGKRRLYVGQVRLEGWAPLSADLYAFPGPRTFTGQDVAELHTLSSPPLVERLVAELLNRGARAAQPGEFTLRAFLAGKLDLTRAEAVLGVIEAADRDELRQALAQLAGGVSRPLERLRHDLLDLLADVEAGLDFAEEDLRFVGREEVLRRLARGLAEVTLVDKQLQQRALSGRPFRVVLAGPPNAGKSSLFNALSGAGALVSPQPGTTRDYLVTRLELGELAVELIDTAGLRETDPGTIESEAQSLGLGQIEQADLVLWCVDSSAAATAGPVTPPLASGGRSMVAIATQCDRSAAPPGLLATSAVTGQGLEQLRQLLEEKARSRRPPTLAPSLSRCRHHLDACRGHLRRAHALVLDEEPAELLALELRGALDQLGEMVGAVYSDDLLDRIFSRFCIGK